MGKYNPSKEVIVIGIKIPKNKAPLYGQNAKAKTTPIKKEPNKPLFLNFSDSFS